ncbi:MAG: signal peptidase II [Clostridiales bacterium]|nr:signal peptidase II [Clostridiales bacterium]
MYYLIVLAVLAIDQFVKFLIVKNFDVGESMTVIKGILEITYYQNNQSALGLRLLGGNMSLMILVTVVLLGALSVYFFKFGKKEHFTLKISIALIVGGGIGNLIDRVAYGYVVDMINFVAFPKIWHYIFNVADAAICVGCAVLLIYVVFFDKDDKQEKRSEGK